MQWHTGMVDLLQKDVVLYHAISPMTNSSQALPGSYGAESLVAGGLMAEGALPTKRLRIAQVGNPLVCAHMFHQTRKEAALALEVQNPMSRNSARWRGAGISNTWSGCLDQSNWTAAQRHSN